MSDEKGQEKEEQETQLGLPHISDDLINQKRTEKTAEGIKKQLLTQGYDALPDPHETLFALIDLSHEVDQSEDPSPSLINPMINLATQRQETPRIHLPQISTQAIQPGKLVSAVVAITSY